MYSLRIVTLIAATSWTKAMQSNKWKKGEEKKTFYISNTVKAA